MKRVLPLYSALMSIRPAALSMVASIAFATGASAQENPRDPDLPEQYKGGMEEVVVRGSAPRWREAPPGDPDWRRPKVDIPDEVDEGRMNWMPEYTAEERDRYDALPRSRYEDPEIKLFEFRF